MFSDNCAGQNRNQFVASMFLLAVNTFNLDVKEHKFLTKGHTQMECDSMHSSIEYVKNNRCVYTLHGWSDNLAMARRKNAYNVKIMQFHDFF